MLEFYALPNHSPKPESDDYKYFRSHIGENFQKLPDYIALRSAELFNVGFIIKLELFHKSDLPKSKMTIKTHPSKGFISNDIIAKRPPSNYNGPQINYYQHLIDWDVKIDYKNATHFLKAEHRNGSLEKGLYLSIKSESQRGDIYALLGMSLWLVSAVVLFFSGLGFWKALAIDTLTALLTYFVFSVIIKLIDKKHSKDNDVFSFFKKYLMTNFDLIEIHKKN